jgi:hypothetical protein
MSQTTFDPEVSAVMLTVLATTLAAIMYVVPVQMALWDTGGKQPGPGSIIVFAVIGVMWLLLLIAMLAAVSSGAFADLSLERSLEYGLGTVAMLAMTTVSLMGMETLPNPQRPLRWFVRTGMRVFPAVTLIFLLQHIQSGWFGAQVAQTIRITWYVCAAANLLIALPFWFVLFGQRIWQWIRVIPGRLLGARGRSADYLETIATIDPQQGFTELMKFSTPYYSGVVRDAAIARARQSPDFIRRLSEELQAGSPDNPLAALARLTLTRDEARVLTEPALAACQEIITNVVGSPRAPGFFEKHVVSFLWLRLMQQVAGRFPEAKPAFREAIAVSRKTLKNWR